MYVCMYLDCVNGTEMILCQVYNGVAGPFVMPPFAAAAGTHLYNVGLRPVKMEGTDWSVNHCIQTMYTHVYYTDWCASISVRGFPFSA